MWERNEHIISNIATTFMEWHDHLSNSMGKACKPHKLRKSTLNYNILPPADDRCRSVTSTDAQQMQRSKNYWRMHWDAGSSDLQLELELPDHLEEALVASPVVLLRPVRLDVPPPAVDHDPVHPSCLEHPQLAHQLVRVHHLTIDIHYSKLPKTHAHELERDRAGPVTSTEEECWRRVLTGSMTYTGT